ncbi:hypothetical protein BHC44_05610 [Snodgrassella alvi]|nr:hypothetical protein BHC44_05610 [Snodgrassella alvi]
MNQNLEKLISAAYSDNKQTLEQLLILFPKDIGGFARKTCSISKNIQNAIQITLWLIHRKIGTLKTIKAFID